MPVPQLPDELWAKICDLIPTDNLKRLYSLNSVFLEVGLDAHYREVTFFPKKLSEKVIKTFLHHLLQPHIARRVRTIKIQSATFFPLLQPADRESSKLSAFLKALVRSRPAPPTATVFQLANQVITQATQAEALSLSSLEGFSYLPPEYFDLAAKAWTAPTDRLHTLEFRGSFIEFATLLRHVATPQKLQCLKLQVTSSQSYPPSYVQNATSACFDFVQQVSATLTELSIDVEPTGGLGIAERQDLLSRIFQSLHNPRLRSFKCNASETIVELELCLTSLLELIGRASPDLRELDVPGLGASEMPDCHFCKLESLTLTNLRTPFHTSPTSTDVLEAAEAYMTRCSCLTSLIFHGNTLSFPQLEGFLQTPPLYEPFQSLHRLQIKVKSLNPQLLAMLAETLTSLRYLTIHHHGLVPDASLEGLVGGWATPQFTTDKCIPRFLEQTPLTDWGLAYLGIKSLSNSHPTYIPGKELVQALQRLIPSLVYGIEIL